MLDIKGKEKHVNGQNKVFSRILSEQFWLTKKVEDS